MANERAEQALAIRERCRQDPEFFFRNILGCNPWSVQVEIANAVRDHKYVAVKSCHAIGKDWDAGRIALWFLFSHEPCWVITTAPTDRQCKEILWKEIAQACSASKVKWGIDVLTQSIELTSTQSAIGFTSKATDPDRFQGFHSANILIIVDEASGISESTYVAIDACLSAGNAHRLEIGNPTNPTSTFAKSFKTPGVHAISVDAFSTPNFTEYGITQEDIENNTWSRKITGILPRPELINPEWVYDKYTKWGKNNPLYLSRILAKFPVSAEDALISYELIEAATARELVPNPDAKSYLAVDVARFGDDFTTIYHRQGKVVRKVERFHGADLMTVTGRAVHAIRELRPDETIVDVVGIGAGVADRLKELGYRVREFNGGNKAKNAEKFYNRRAEAYWILRENIDALSIDRDNDTLVKQLTDIKWSVDSKERVKLESKDDIKKRLGCSPDDADAVSMLFDNQSELHYVHDPSTTRTQYNLFGVDMERVSATM